MEMKEFVILKTTLLLVLLAFRGFAADNDEHYLNGNGYQYRFISMEQVEISRGQTITGILTYIGYNCDFDYDFTVFLNPKNEEIIMRGGPGPEQFFSRGEKVKVIWKLTTLYEAGEGDAPYYFWSIVEIEKIYN